MPAPLGGPFAAAQLFPFELDPQYPVSVSEALATDIMAPAHGPEVRASLRSVGIRTLTFTPVFATAQETMAFFAAWLGAAESLRYDVPVWPEVTRPTALSDDGLTLSTDTTNRDGFAPGARCLLTLDAEHCEVVTIDDGDDAVTDTTVRLAAPVVGTYPYIANAIGPTRLVPLMTAWIAPPTRDQLNLEAERVPLEFVEEVAGVAGITPDVDGIESPGAVETLRLDLLAYWNGVTDSPFDGDRDNKRIIKLRARAYDKAGVEIESPELAWSFVRNGGAPAPLTVVSLGEREFLLMGDPVTSDMSYDVTCAAGMGGAVTATLHDR